MTRSTMLLCGWLVAGCGGADDNDGASFGAELEIGGLDRVVVYRDSGDRCLQLRLVSPASASDDLPDVALPAGWGLEMAWQNRLSICDAQGLAGAEVAEGGSGTITFGALGVSGLPCSVSVDVTLDFYADSERFARSAIPVTGVAPCP